MFIFPVLSFPPVTKRVSHITMLAEFTLPWSIWKVFLVPKDVMYRVHSKLSGGSLSSSSWKLSYIPPHTMMSPLASNPPVAPYFGTVSNTVISEQVDPMLSSTVKTLLFSSCPVKVLPPMITSLSEGYVTLNTGFFVNIAPFTPEQSSHRASCPVLMKIVMLVIKSVSVSYTGCTK